MEGAWHQSFLEYCTNGVSDHPAPDLIQFASEDLGGPFGQFSGHSERWVSRRPKSAGVYFEVGALRCCGVSDMA